MFDWTRSGLKQIGALPWLQTCTWTFYLAVAWGLGFLPLHLAASAVAFPLVAEVGFTHVLRPLTTAMNKGNKKIKKRGKRKARKRGGLPPHLKLIGKALDKVGLAAFLLAYLAVQQGSAATGSRVAPVVFPEAKAASQSIDWRSSARDVYGWAVDVLKRVDDVDRLAVSLAVENLMSALKHDMRPLFREHENEFRVLRGRVMRDRKGRSGQLFAELEQFGPDAEEKPFIERLRGPLGREKWISLNNLLPTLPADKKERWGLLASFVRNCAHELGTSLPVVGARPRIAAAPGSGEGRAGSPSVGPSSGQQGAPAGPELAVGSPLAVPAWRFCPGEGRFVLERSLSSGEWEPTPVEVDGGGALAAVSAASSQGVLHVVWTESANGVWLLRVGEVATDSPDGIERVRVLSAGLGEVDALSMQETGGVLLVEVAVEGAVYQVFSTEILGTKIEIASGPMGEPQVVRVGDSTGAAVEKASMDMLASHLSTGASAEE